MTKQWRGAGVASLGLVLLLAQPAGAKGHAERLELGKLKVAQSQASAIGNASLASADARCPRGYRAISGGFEQSSPDGASTGILYESRKLGQHAWRVSTQVETSSAASTLSLVAFAYCSSRAPATKTISVQRPAPYHDSFAVCPHGRQALAGGFVTGPPFVGGSATSFIASDFRSGTSGFKSDMWITHLDRLAGSTTGITVYAYCARVLHLPVPLGQFGSAQQTDSSSSVGICQGKSRPFGGGFFAQTTTARHFIVVSSRLLFGGEKPAWSVVGQFRGGPPSGFPDDLGPAIVYCV